MYEVVVFVWMEENDMKLQIRLFAGLAERVGAPVIDIELNGDTYTVQAVKEELAKLHPLAADAVRASFLAKNRAYASDDTAVNAEDELALIPPVSGGDSAIESPAGQRFLLT